MVPKTVYEQHGHSQQCSTINKKSEKKDEQYKRTAQLGIS
jgi:hypothetical protein